MSTDYSAGTGNESVIKNTKNEPVVSRNIFHEAIFHKGAKQTPGYEGDRTKEVRTFGNRDDFG